MKHLIQNNRTIVFVFLVATPLIAVNIYFQKLFGLFFSLDRSNFLVNYLLNYLIIFPLAIGFVKVTNNLLSQFEEEK